MHTNLRKWKKKKSEDRLLLPGLALSTKFSPLSSSTAFPLLEAPHLWNVNIFWMVLISWLPRIRKNLDGASNFCANKYATTCRENNTTSTWDEKSVSYSLTVPTNVFSFRFLAIRTDEEKENWQTQSFELFPNTYRVIILTSDIPRFHSPRGRHSPPGTWN